jgi:hypothetical protein
LLLASVIAAATAVEDINHQIAPEARILHFSQISFDITYPAYDIPAIKTTKNQIQYGFKNCKFIISIFISFVYQIKDNKFAIENFSSGKSGNITIDIIANFIVLFNSSLLTFCISFSIKGLEDKINVKIIVKMIAICE